MTTTPLTASVDQTKPTADASVTQVLTDSIRSMRDALAALCERTGNHILQREVIGLRIPTLPGSSPTPSAQTAASPERVRCFRAGTYGFYAASGPVDRLRFVGESAEFVRPDGSTSESSHTLHYALGEAGCGNWIEVPDAPAPAPSDGATKVVCSSCGWTGPRGHIHRCNPNPAPSPPPTGSISEKVEAEYERPVNLPKPPPEDWRARCKVYHRPDGRWDADSPCGKFFLTILTSGKRWEEYANVDSPYKGVFASKDFALAALASAPQPPDLKTPPAKPQEEQTGETEKASPYDKCDTCQHDRDSHELGYGCHVKNCECCRFIAPPQSEAQSGASEWLPFGMMPADELFSIDVLPTVNTRDRIWRKYADSLRAQLTEAEKALTGIVNKGHDQSRVYTVALAKEALARIQSPKGAKP